jgi:hypothetical protein
MNDNQISEIVASIAAALHADWPLEKLVNIYATRILTHL